MTGHIYPADHPHATDNAFRRCGMLREGGFRRLGRPMQIERVRRRTLSLKRRLEHTGVSCRFKI